MDKFVRGVRADGSQAVSMTRIATVNNRLLAVDKREVIDTVNARDTNIDVTTKSLSTVPLDQQELSHLKARRTGTCAAAKDGVTIEPAAPLFGLSIVKVTTRWKDPEGAPVIAESWLAPDLNCASLREVISKQESSGKATPMKITEVASLVRGEPDANLFAIPAGYTERTPGQVSKTLAGLIGLDCPKCAVRGEDHANARYQQKRAAAGWR